MFYLTAHSVHFIYGYMAWMMEHMVNSARERKPTAISTFRLAARDLLYASSH